MLGSGTLLPSAERASAAHYLEVGRARVLFDCGSGTLHGMARHGVPWNALTHVCVTHYHGDHVGDLAAILFALRNAPRPRRREPLTLVGPPGFGDLLRRLAEALGSHVVDPGFPVHVIELSPDDTAAGPGFELRAVPTPHTDESVAYRVEGSWGAFGYTGDTGPSAEVADFMRGVDVLVAECGFADPPPSALHLAPSGVAELAGAAEPGLLVVTHVYPPLDHERAVEAVRARGYTGAIRAAHDGLGIAWRAGEVAVAPRGTSV